MRKLSSKGLENYTPGEIFGGTLEALRKNHPDLKLFLSATKKSGQKLKAGDWVKIKNGSNEKIIAFDKYRLPPTYKLITRAISHSCVDTYLFTDINE